jgi:hypothetical protein
METCRLNNIWFESISPFLLDAENLILKKEYKQELIFQIDETSCLLSKYRLPGRVGPARRKSIPCEALPLVYRCTVLFIIQGNGEHLYPHLLLPSSVDPLILGGWRPTKIFLHFTPNGWMDKGTFEKIIRKYLLPEILGIRSSLGEGDQKGALLLCDGHSSRMNLPLMKDLSSADVEVGIFPSHSSSETQALDLCPNAQFKAALKSIKPVFPSKAHMKEEVRQFIDNIQDAAEAALLRRNVKNGWKRSGLLWGSMEEKLNSLDFRPPGYPLPTHSTRFSISGQWITDPKFLEHWMEHDGRKSIRMVRRKKVREKEIEAAVMNRKRRKIMIDDDDEPLHTVADDRERKGDEKEKLSSAPKLKRSEVITEMRRKKEGLKVKEEDDFTDSEEAMSSESTTASDFKDLSIPLNPFHLIVDQTEQEESLALSADELAELRRSLLEERMIHPSKRPRKPVRPFSPDPVLRKKKFTREDVLRATEEGDLEDFENMKCGDEKRRKTEASEIISPEELLQLAVLNLDFSEDDEADMSASDYEV